MKSKISVILFCFIIIIFFTDSPSAQSFKWVNHQTLSIPFNPDIASFISAADTHGNSLLASIYNYKIIFSGYYGDVSVKKFDPSGALLFNKILYGKVLTEHVQTDNSSNIYVTGTFMDTLNIDNTHFLYNTGTGFSTNDFIIKLDQNGDFVWAKNLAVTYPGFNLDAVKIKGGYMFAGLLNFDQGSIKKFDLNGNEVMSIIQSPVRGISGIDIDELGNIYSVGSCGNVNVNFGGQMNTAPFVYNAYFVKYNSSGTCQWARFVEDVTFSHIDVACDHSGSLYASGNLHGSFFFGNIQAQGSQWVYDFFLTKIDASGNFVWLREVPNTPTITGDAGKAKVNAMAVDNQNNVYFSGFLRSTVNWGNNVITTSTGYMDVLVLKFNPNGIIQWGKKAGGTGGNRADNISIDNSGNLFIAGNLSSTVTFDTITVTGTGNINPFIAKIQMAGQADIGLIMEGFYDSASDNLRMQDTVTMFLRSSAPPYSVADSARSVIDAIKFKGSFPVINASSGSYFMEMKHRNSLETWSSSPVSYSQGGNINYDFTTSKSRAYGNNMTNVNNSPPRFAIYSGDIQQDGAIDVNDLSLADNDAFNFVSGYVNTDVTGDNVVDAADIAIVDNNAFNFVSVSRP